MKIVVVSTPVFRLGSSGTVGYSGLEHLAWQQAKGLAQKGHEVSLVAPDGSVCPGVTIIPMGPERRIDERGAYSKYWQELLKADCVIDASWQKHSVLLKMEGRLKAPILGVMHAPVDTMYKVLPPPGTCSFVCISQDQANHFEALHQREARVARNGVDSSFYQATGAPRTKRFLFCARFSTIKGPLLCIQGSRLAGASLDLIGDTSITNEPDYFNQCLNEADGDKIKIIGAQSRGNCVWWMSRAHAFLHGNKLFREPLGLAPLEAQLCGLPVVAFDNGALRETVKHGETGFLVKTVEQFNERVRELNQSEVSEQTRKRCREWAMQFSVEKMVDRYDELVREAADTGGW